MYGTLQGQSGNVAVNQIPSNDVLFQLKQKQTRLQQDLHKTTEAIEALEGNPDLIKILNAIQGGLY